MLKPTSDFAVIYRGYLKPGRENDYQNAWQIIAQYFIKHRGAIGSCLHRTADGMWVAYSRWPEQKTRDASWSRETTPSDELPLEIQKAVAIIQESLDPDRRLPDICMEVVAEKNSLPHRPRTSVYGIALQDKKLLLIKQQKGPHAGKWDLPGGGIEAGETIEQALRREFQEEVNMAFSSMHLWINATATTEWMNESGKPSLFHQIGLIYQVENVTQLQKEATELEYAWIDIEQLAEVAISPFVQQSIKQGLTLTHT